jgi:hypothetical protein
MSLTSLGHIVMIKEDLVRAEPYSVILHNGRVFALVPLHVSDYFVFELAKVIFHTHVKCADLLLYIHCRELSCLVLTILRWDYFLFLQ